MIKSHKVLNSGNVFTGREGILSRGAPKDLIFYFLSTVADTQVFTLLLSLNCMHSWYVPFCMYNTFHNFKKFQEFA